MHSVNLYDFERTLDRALFLKDKNQIKNLALVIVAMTVTELGRLRLRQRAQTP